jgi:hypothetical protein
MLDDATRSLKTPRDWDELENKLPARDRGVVRRHLEAMQSTDEARARIWQQLACAMFTLAPNPPAAAQNALQFYVPDGRFRMQVFAMHDVGDGSIAVYCENVLKEAMAAGLLVERKPSEVATGGYRIRAAGAGGKSSSGSANAAAGASDGLIIDTLDGRTENLPIYCKHMTGWNRRALRITLPPKTSAQQVKAAQTLCALAAQTWVVAPQTV